MGVEMTSKSKILKKQTSRKENSRYHVFIKSDLRDKPTHCSMRTFTEFLHQANLREGKEDQENGTLVGYLVVVRNYW